MFKSNKDPRVNAKCNKCANSKHRNGWIACDKVTGVVVPKAQMFDLCKHFISNNRLRKEDITNE